MKVGNERGVVVDAVRHAAHGAEGVGVHLALGHAAFVGGCQKHDQFPFNDFMQQAFTGGCGFLSHGDSPAPEER